VKPCWNIIYIGLLTSIVFSYPNIYKKIPRIFKDIIRLSNGFVIGFVILLIIKGYIFAGILGIILVHFIKKIYNNLRAKNKLKDCDGCIELESGKTCSGYSLQTRQLLIFEEAFSRKLGLRANIKEI